MHHSPQAVLLKKRATYAAVVAATTIIVAKLIGWFMTSSLSILATLVDSLLDIVASIMNLLAVSYALQPPDEDHRFGHEKAEDIAAFTQAAFITGSALFVIATALRRFFTPEVVHPNIIGIYVMVFSVCVTGALVYFQSYVIKRTQSAAIKADSLHYFSDLITNFCIIIALIIQQYWPVKWLDPCLAVIISGYMIKSGWHIAISAFNNLMDREFDNEQREKIFHIIHAHPEVKGVHDLKTRWAGNKPFIQFHLELDGDMPLRQAHTIADEIESKVLEAFPYAEIFIHQDPEEEYRHLKNASEP